MSCCITAHYNLLALPVFPYLAENNQTFNFSFFFTAIVLRILSFLHAHHDTAIDQCNHLHPARTASLYTPVPFTGTALCYPWGAADTLKQFLQGKKLVYRVYSTMTYI